MTQDVELLDVTDAQRRLLEHFFALGRSVVALAEGVGRILAEPVYASINLPAFTNSAMDGFAVRAADLVGAARSTPVRLKVIADVPAGAAPSCSIRSGEAARIMTGAPLPEGADAVAPVEITDFDYRHAGTSAPDYVSIFQPVQVGEHLRQIGQDVRAGDLVLPAGIRLRPQDIGLLSMLGAAAVTVSRKPKIGIFSSGDELIQPGESLTPGKIYDSNSATLAGMVERSGAEAVLLGVARDTEVSVREILNFALTASCDLILSSAGVSVGSMDYVRKIVEDEGEVAFWRVNMRPGKPFLFGKFGQTPFIGLPGNPVSAYVGFIVFVLPAIEKMLGRRPAERNYLRAELLEEIHSDGRESYLRGIVRVSGGRLTAKLTGHQGSGNLHSLVQANALLLVPSGVKYLPSGDQVEILLLDNWF